MIVTVTPAPSLDRTYTATEFQIGRVNRAVDSQVEASGKGVNVSRALAAAGADTVAVLPLGGPEGRQLAELLAADGVVYRSVEADTHTRTNTTLAITGLPTTKMNAPALPIEAAVWTDLLGLVGELLRPGDWVLCSGTVPPGAERLPAQLIELARSRQARSAVDSSGPALESALHARPDLLAPNHLELAELVGEDVSALPPDGSSTDPTMVGDRALIETAAGWSRDLARRTGGAVLATLGASGALYSDGVDCWHAIAPPIIPINTVGAGDALLAGFLSVAAAPDFRPAEVAAPTGALATAVAWGTAACTMPGTAGDVAALADLEAVTVRLLLR